MSKFYFLVVFHTLFKKTWNVFECSLQVNGISAYISGNGEQKTHKYKKLVMQTPFWNVMEHLESTVPYQYCIIWSINSRNLHKTTSDAKNRFSTLHAFHTNFVLMLFVVESKKVKIFCFEAQINAHKNAKLTKIFHFKLCTVGHSGSIGCATFQPQCG